MKEELKLKLLYAFLVLASAFFILQVKSISDPLNFNRYQLSTQNEVIFPQSGDTLKLGKSYTISWVAKPGSTDIFLINHILESEGVSVSIADRVYNIPNTGSYNYKVPTNIPAGEYKFVIGDLNSEYFEIVK